jgi:glycosyltransferase involved in cell wall biosynthesis
MKIFVQIASYRDPQLVPTINSMLENAKHPENVIVGVARQFHPDDKFDDLSEYENKDNFRILNIPYEKSLGVCWARNQVQQLYKDEEYTLQIDSHMRFAPNWDVEMIQMIKDLQDKGYKKPLLTGYVSSFDPDKDPELRVQEPWRMAFDRFTPEGIVFFLPETIPGWQELDLPVPARFYSAHYCFTLGEFSKEVQHDPEFYFHGEEISITVRAYTHGYDLFHPHKVLIWHEYTRKGRTKQWDDDKEWWKKNEFCHKKNRQLLGIDGEVYDGDLGIYGLGTERTIKDYERYSGVLFSKRAVQKYTLDKNYPPNPYDYETEEEWINSFSSIFKHCIDVAYDLVPEDDYEFWVVAFHNEKDETLHRQDADEYEIRSMKNDPDGYCKVWREFNTTERPKYWVVWPYSKSKGWCDRLTGNL